MAFTVRDFHDLVGLLRDHPEWQVELRHLLLTEELLTLPDLVRQLVEAQQRAEERLGRLEAVVEQLSATVQQLAAAQQRTEEQLERLGTTVESLAERVGHLVDEVGGLKGRELERRYREYAPAYFSDLLRRIRVISPQELATLLEDAVEAGILSPAEQKDLLMSDVVVRGRRREDGTEVYMVAEVSVGIGQKDVGRAVKRARLLHRALQRPTMAAVAGEWINVEAERQARALGVWWVLDGTAHAPNRKSLD